MNVQRHDKLQYSTDRELPDVKQHAVYFFTHLLNTACKSRVGN